MYRTLRSIVVAVSLLVALSACDALFDTEMSAISLCYNLETHDYDCCNQDTPRDHPKCLDGGADAAADASDGGEADAGSDDGGPPADEVCPWACTPTGGAGFGPFPSYVWIGDEDQESPPPIGLLKFTSWVDVDLKPPTCPTCSCVAPTNASEGCVLPTVWNVESKACQELSSPSVTPLDPPANWKGSCTSTNPIAEGLMCEGEPCVKSFVLQPPTIAPCVAESVMPPDGQPVDFLDHMRVIEYVSSSNGSSCGSTSNCIAPPPTNYKLCLVANDIDVAVSCPDGWTDQYVGWREVTNTRTCSACTCGAPEGASCTVRASVYADDACTDERGNMMLTSTDAAQCIDLAVGTALGSKTAEVLAYQPGTCAPSTSEVLGEVTFARPVTYCCVPSLRTPP